MNNDMTDISNKPSIVKRNSINYLLENKAKKILEIDRGVSKLLNHLMNPKYFSELSHEQRLHLLTTVDKLNRSNAGFMIEFAKVASQKSSVIQNFLDKLVTTSEDSNPPDALEDNVIDVEVQKLTVEQKKNAKAKLWNFLREEHKQQNNSGENQ